jgi:hypothetical protein
MMTAEQTLRDSDGENQAVRCFLMLYGCGQSPTIPQMREHMRESGFPHWPKWAETERGHLTKGGAQDWLRHLFSMEASPTPSAEQPSSMAADALQEFAEYFAQRNVEATGDWRAAYEDCQHHLDALLSSPKEAASNVIECDGCQPSYRCKNSCALADEAASQPQEASKTEQRPKESDMGQDYAGEDCPHETCERINGECPCTRAALSAAGSDSLSADKVEWIVNDNAELGVKIGDQCFFLYKGESLVYESGKHDDGTPMMYRMVGKREFGECCHPVKFWKPGAQLPKRYTDELVYTPGLSFGAPEDGAWKPVPAALRSEQQKEGK